MNVMSALIPEVASTSNVKVAKGQQKGDRPSFQSFLQTNEQTDQVGNKDGTNDQGLSNVVESSVSNEETSILDETIFQNGENMDLMELLAKLLNGEGLRDFVISEEQARKLQNLLKELEGSHINIAPEIIEQIELFLHRESEESPSKETSDMQVINVIDSVIQTDESIHNEMIQLIGEISRILNGDEAIPLKEKAGELLPLLRQWTALKEQTEEGEAERIIHNGLSEKASTILKQLVNVYEKRNYFTDNNLYRSDSAVTRTDVMNWLQQAFSNYETQGEKVSAQVVATHQQIPMTEIQQYTIHVQSLDRVDRISDEILTKFNHIIRESRFLTNNNLNQLSITLRPENLGNMTVRFTQIDGEMAVKIIVSSQAAKSMLESNIHQLKHMFSPHQVVIERDESISDEEFFGKEEELEENEEESLNDGRDARENDEDDTPEIDFTDLFQQLSEEEISE